jgi:hypothetical protein
MRSAARPRAGLPLVVLSGSPRCDPANVSQQTALRGQRGELSTGELVVLLTVVALLGLAFAAIAHHGCTTYPADIARPEPGSPRAGYCAVADASFPLVQIAVSLLIVSGAWLMTGRNMRIVGFVALAVVLILFGDMLLASNLDAWGFDHSADAWQAFRAVR